MQTDWYTKVKVLTHSDEKLEIRSSVKFLMYIPGTQQSIREVVDVQWLLGKWIKCMIKEI